RGAVRDRGAGGNRKTFPRARWPKGPSIERRTGRRPTPATSRLSWSFSVAEPVWSARIVGQIARGVLQLSAVALGVRRISRFLMIAGLPRRAVLRGVLREVGMTLILRILGGQVWQRRCVRWHNRFGRLRGKGRIVEGRESIRALAGAGIIGGRLMRIVAERWPIVGG